ncbi:hypothetical protein BDU57DRAFT_537018 [Ampelomyces quisqualis]|uniref:RING-type domain-containing protein n=1 Tax=Ampelomyces quisqualis TaxID=50730 RepID=A0A6A5QPJ7_AMPQU|nr:hypothetical protein BDU57DRAFT_537018 [Ampelomyces quisqualis]
MASWMRIWDEDNDFRSIFDHPFKYFEVPESERNSQGLDVLATLFVDRLEEVKLKNHPAGNDICPICWEGYGKQGYECARPLKTPCGHVFGRKCLIRTITECQWNCAICRQDMLFLAFTAADQRRKREEEEEEEKEGISRKLCRQLIWLGFLPFRIIWNHIKPSSR